MKIAISTTITNNLGLFIFLVFFLIFIGYLLYRFKKSIIDDVKVIMEEKSRVDEEWQSEVRETMKNSFLLGTNQQEALNSITDILKHNNKGLNYRNEKIDNELDKLTNEEERISNQLNEVRKKLGNSKDQL